MANGNISQLCIVQKLLFPHCFYLCKSRKLHGFKCFLDCRSEVTEAFLWLKYWSDVVIGNVSRMLSSQST